MALHVGQDRARVKGHVVPGSTRDRFRHVAAFLGDAGELVAWRNRSRIKSGTTMVLYRRAQR
jgi:hypothetical protein